MQRRRFTAEFKREAVRLATRSGTSRAQVAQELGLNAAMLSKWVREASSGRWEMTPGKGLKTESQAELDRMRRELKRVTTERDILKNCPRGLPRPICIETSGAYT